MNIPVAKLPNENLLVRPIHTAVKGRARYKVKGLLQEEAFKKYLEFRLSKEDGIGQVHANHVTGNVLVFFEPDIGTNAIALLLQNIILDYRKEVGKLSLTTVESSTVKQEITPWHIWSAGSLLTQLNTSSVSGLSSISARDKLKQDGLNILKSKNQALLSQTVIRQQLVRVTGQRILITGVVGILVLGTLLLHKYGFDTKILLAIQKLHTPISDRIMLGITYLGEPATLLSICLGLGIGPLFKDRRSQATTLGIAALSAFSLNYWLKMLFGRARPELWNRIIDVRLHSFPSGHAMMSMVIYGFLSYMLAKQFPQWRGQIFISTAILITAIGFSRLYLGVHWPTDVVAGYAAGLMCLIVCIFILELQQQDRSLPEIS